MPIAIGLPAIAVIVRSPVFFMGPLIQPTRISSKEKGPTSRKASLQRYLEKRKDRFKGKKILGGSTSSDMEMMYISQKLRCLNHSELPNLNETSFPALSQPPQSPARCSSAENQSGNKYFIDLNDDSE
ncbi:leaf development [Musa troglodytarum]|uniref:Leaf development n=1 Tax=Musa troglodytarum TaxID=320322 RepID=A0A9E7KVG1_9LILI|nr:leaf development [Musa troglodytarum]